MDKKSWWLNRLYIQALSPVVCKLIDSYPQMYEIIINGIFFNTLIIKYFFPLTVYKEIVHNLSSMYGEIER